MSDKVIDYIKGLRIGEAVVETGLNAMTDAVGIVEKSKMHEGNCVRWEPLHGSSGQLVTAITYGTRRLGDSYEL